MIDTIKSKIRTLVEDFEKKDLETFIYANSSIFTLSEENIEEITSVKKNGVVLGSGDYDWDSTNNELTIIASLSSGDIIIVKYTYYKYSNTEILGQLENAFHWLSIFDTDGEDYEVETTGIYPTPDNKVTDLIAIIASILIKPNYNSYSLPNLRVTYPKTMTKEDRIEQLINRFKSGIGVTGVIEFD